jgi:glycosyltransferase involved in cell wall biosynthesis
MAKLTIITATYNKPELLKQASKSILSQTDKDWTWIIALNGPTLETRGVAYGLQSKHPLARILVTEVPVSEEERKQNYQPSLIANLMFDCADSEYLAWLSDDDLWKPDFIAKMCSCDASYCSVARYVQNGLQWNFNCINWAVEPWQYGMSDGGSLVIKKKVWEELGWRFPLDPALSSYADQQFMQKVNEKHPLRAIRDVLMIKRHSWNSAHQKGRQ